MKFSVFLFFLLISFSSVAQQRAAVKISNPLKLSAKTSRFKVIGKNNDGILVRLYGTQDVIAVFDNDLKLTASTTIDFKNQSGLLQHVMLNKTGAVIFYLQQDKKYSVLYAQPLNSKLLEIGKPILIDSIMDRKDMVAANLRFKQSVDQSSLLIYYPFFSNNRVDVIKFICLDRGLRTLYNKIVPVGRQENALEESKALIDNNGSSFLLLNVGNSYDVMHLASNGEFSTYNVSAEKKIFNEAWFEIDNKNGNLVMTALCEDDKRIGDKAASGFLYASFDPANGTPLKTNYTPFPKDFISELTGRENPTNLSLYTFNIRKAILRNDGGVLILAESFIRDRREMPVNNMSMSIGGLGMQPGYNSYRTSDIFQFNDIIAFSVNANGVMEWNSILRKKQASEDDNGTYSSFLVVNEKEKLHLLYLDDVSFSGTLSEYSLSSDGRSERKSLLNQEEKEVMLLPKMGKQISPDEVVIPSYRNNALRLIKITF